MPNNLPIPRLGFTETETGKILGLSARTVFSLRAAGKIGFVKLGDGAKSRVIYPLAAIEAYLASNTQVVQVRAEGAK